DVRVPDLEITAGACIDRRLVVRLHAAGKHERVGGRAAAWLGRQYRGDGRLARLAIERVARAQAAQNSPHREQQDENDRGPEVTPVARRNLGGTWRVIRHQALRRPWMMLKTVGTKKSVATVANTRPPITARPRGAFCSPPSPRPSAIGSMPMIIASAVINTGRMRVAPPSSAAASGSAPSARRWRAKAMSRMLFAVATPIIIIAPVSDGTLSVVPVMKSIHAMPASAAGSAAITMAASSQDWKFTTMRR